MALLRDLSTGALTRVGARCRLGRGGVADVIFREQVEVSKVHALLEYTSDGWTLLDLASTNGTWVQGGLVSSGARVRLHAGHRISLGGPNRELILEDDAAPEAFARHQLSREEITMAELDLILPGEGRARLTEEGGWEWIPEPHRPERRLLRDPDGQHVGDYRIYLPIVGEATARTHLPCVADIHLRLTFQAGKECPALSLRLPGVPDSWHRLGTQVYNWYFLVLVEQLLEAGPGVWIGTAEAEHQSGLSKQQLFNANLWLRSRLLNLGVADGREVVVAEPGRIRLNLRPDQVRVEKPLGQ